MFICRIYNLEIAALKVIANLKSIHNRQIQVLQLNIRGGDFYLIYRHSAGSEIQKLTLI